MSVAALREHHMVGIHFKFRCLEFCFSKTKIYPTIDYFKVPDRINRLIFQGMSLQIFDQHDNLVLNIGNDESDESYELILA